MPVQSQIRQNIQTPSTRQREEASDINPK